MGLGDLNADNIWLESKNRGNSCWKKKSKEVRETKKL